MYSYPNKNEPKTKTTTKERKNKVIKEIIHSFYFFSFFLFALIKEQNKEKELFTSSWQYRFSTSNALSVINGALVNKRENELVKKK